MTIFIQLKREKFVLAVYNGRGVSKFMSNVHSDVHRTRKDIHQEDRLLKLNTSTLNSRQNAHRTQTTEILTCLMSIFTCSRFPYEAAQCKAVL